MTLPGLTTTGCPAPDLRRPLAELPVAGAESGRYAPSPSREPRDRVRTRRPGRATPGGGPRPARIMPAGPPRGTSDALCRRRACPSTPGRPAERGPGLGIAAKEGEAGVDQTGDTGHHMEKRRPRSGAACTRRRPPGRRARRRRPRSRRSRRGPRRPRLRCPRRRRAPRPRPPRARRPVRASPQ